MGKLSILIGSLILSLNAYATPVDEVSEEIGCKVAQGYENVFEEAGRDSKRRSVLSEDVKKAYCLYSDYLKDPLRYESKLDEAIEIVEKEDAVNLMLAPMYYAKVQMMYVKVTGIAMITPDFERPSNEVAKALLDAEKEIQKVNSKRVVLCQIVRYNLKVESFCR
jgi:hypothetical protein